MLSEEVNQKLYLPTDMIMCVFVRMCRRVLLIFFKIKSL